MQDRRSGKAARRKRREAGGGGGGEPAAPRGDNVARAPGEPSGGRWRDALALALAVGLVLRVYLWVVSAGTTTTWPTYTDYHQKLASAFLHGQASLLEAPDPRLLALPDPYRYPDNVPYKLHDVSLYEGRYYLYWGPVPALGVALCNLVLRVRAIPDQVVTFAFTAGTLLVLALLLWMVRRRTLPDVPAWALGAGVVIVGLANPTPFNLARAAVYEASIAAGQFFLLGGIAAALAGLYRRGREPGRVSTGWLWVAGVSWALALGSRISLLPTLAVLVPLVAWRARRASGGGWTSRPVWRAAAAVALPVGATGVALGVYNLARFGSFTEFGQRYQLAAVNLLANYDRQFSVGNVMPNVYTYLLRPPDLTGMFPFVLARSGLHDAFPPFLTPSTFYVAFEASAGMLLAAPFVWFAVAGVYRALARRRRAARAPESGGAGATRVAGEGGDGLRWLAWALLAAAVVTPLPVLLQSGSGMRYLAELTYPLMLLAVIGFWHGLVRLRGRRGARAGWLAAGGVLAVLTVAPGVLLGVTGTEGNHFGRNNRPLLQRLMEATYFGPVPGIGQVTSAVGLDDAPGGGVWVGQQMVHLDLMADREGWVRLDLLAKLGPCLDGSPGGRIAVAGQPKDPSSTTLDVLGVVPVPRGDAPAPVGMFLRLTPGLNRFFLLVPDPPTRPTGRDEQGCRRMIAVSQMTVRDAPGPVAPATRQAPTPGR